MNNNNSPSILSAKELFKYKKITPTLPSPIVMFLCFSDSLFECIIKKYQNKQINGFFGDLRLFKIASYKIGILGQFGIGSPVTAVLTEDLHEWGVKILLGIGLGSTIQKTLQIGEFLIIDKALRGDGTSIHYEQDNSFSFASENLLQKIVSSCDFQPINVVIGSSWTTDAIYRETVEKITNYQNLNIQAVEMECASLYTVATYCSMQCLFLLCISDSVADLKWVFKNNIPDLNERFLTIFGILLDYVTHELI